MGHIQDIANQSKIQSFPGAAFAIEGDVPAAQCSDAQIQSTTGQTFAPPLPILRDVGKFVGYALAGKFVTITASVGGSTGTFGITGNTNDDLDLASGAGNGNPVTYYVHDGGELILTRDTQSFIDWIVAAGYAYTIKGGVVYTDIPTLQVQPACKILFDPLT